MRQIPQTLINVIIIFCITFTLYLLSFNGIPIGSDEELYASAARNFVLNNDLNAGQLYGNLRLEGNYHGVEPAYPILASLWYRLIIQFPIGRLQGFYFFPIFCISAAAAVIVILARQLGFSLTASTVAGIMFGLGTIAWPYSKYLFRETLLVLLFMLCWLCFEILIRKDLTFWKIFLWSGAFVSLVALSVLTKITAVFIIPAFIIMFLTRKISNRKWNLKSWFILGAGSIAFLALGMFLLAQKTTDISLFYRYTGSFIADAIARYRGTSYNHFWEALIAPLVSPWKGIFVYSPPCLFAFLSIFQKNNWKSLYLFILPFVTTLGFLSIQALAYNNEWWTATWSSRFLLPVVPLFIIAALPWLETTLQERNQLRVFIFRMVSVVGVLIQIGAVIFHASSYDGILFNEFQQDFPEKIIWSIPHMPIWGQWKLALTGTEPALLLWRDFAAQPTLVIMVTLAGFIFVAGMLFFLKQNLKDEQVHQSNYSPLFTSLGIQFSLFVLALNLSTYDPFYLSSHSSDLRKICTQLNLNQEYLDAVVVKPYTGDVWYYFMNNDCTKTEWFSLPFGSQIESSPEIKALAYNLFTTRLMISDRVWLVNQTWNSEDGTDKIFSSNGFHLISQEQYSLPDSQIIFSLYSRKSK